MTKLKQVHFVGIKGVGMASLAIILKEAGLIVTGSDDNGQYITDSSLQKAGINFYEGFSGNHINKAELLIATGAHGGFENIEVITAKKRGKQVVTFAEAVGMFMEGSITGRSQKAISVAGTHGKTTTTAMIATILQKCNLDPSYLIGTSYIPTLINSGHFGTGEFFVVEADEYASEPIYDKRAKFLWHKPAMAIITNIEHDHPDIYPTLESFISAFDKFIHSLPLESTLIVNGDDLNIRRIINNIKLRVITFGLNQNNDVIISEVKSDLESTRFRLKYLNHNFGEFILNVAGIHNCMNATAAIIASYETGLSVDSIRKSIYQFTGSKRRLELLGKLKSGGILYDDYAHHPTEIQKTLKALREIYPHKKIISIFQPHTYSRTKVLFKDFGISFTDSDVVILMDIFPSAREKTDFSISSSKLADEIRKHHPNVIFLPQIDNVVKYFDEFPPSGDDLVITIGAGDVYKIGQKLQVIS